MTTKKIVPLIKNLNFAIKQETASYCFLLLHIKEHKPF